MKAPKYTDRHRFARPYVPVAEQGEGYLARRFKEIEEQQRENAAERLRKTITLRARSK